jgi:serine/threonine protein kinase
MFQDPSPGSELRLIDFGSGTLDAEASPTELTTHTTFAGSAFYISPEMFQHTYTVKTDVWSAGVTLYVLVAGYPADALQKAFNILQKSDRDLKKLPNLPENMPDSFYDLLQDALVYRHKKRPSAGELLNHEFVTFHKSLTDEPGISLEEVSSAAAKNPTVMTSLGTGSIGRTANVSLKGSVVRHNLFLGFKKFERSVTTLLAAMLSKQELQQLLQILKQRDQAAAAKASETLMVEAVDFVKALDEEKGDTGGDGKTNEQKLAVIRMSELKTILREELKNQAVYVSPTSESHQ